MKRASAFDYFSDTTRIAMIGRLSKGQRDLSLVVATRDTAKEKKVWEKRVKKAEEKGEKPKKVRPKWKLKELDHGIFGEMTMNLDVSPDNSFIVYPKYRYGKNQSLLYDIWKINVETKKKIAVMKRRQLMKSTLVFIVLRQSFLLKISTTWILKMPRVNFI